MWCDSMTMLRVLVIPNGWHDAELCHAERSEASLPLQVQARLFGREKRSLRVTLTLDTHQALQIRAFGEM